MSKKKKAPYFPLYVFDFQTDPVVKRLTNAGVGIYIKLLMWQWGDGGIDVEPEDIQDYCHASDEEWAKTWRRLEAKFPVSNDGKRRNPRLEEERENMKRAAARRSQQAKSAAEARWTETEQLDAPSMPRASVEHAASIPGALPEHSSSMLVDAIREPEPDTEPEEKTLGATPVALWRENDIELDEEWLRSELSELQEQIGTVLTREEYESERDALQRRLLADPRCRATAKSKPSQHKRAQTFVLTHFREAIRRKAERMSRGKQRSRSPAELGAEPDYGRDERALAERQERIMRCADKHPGVHALERLKPAEARGETRMYGCRHGCGLAVPESQRAYELKKRARVQGARAHAGGGR